MYPNALRWEGQTVGELGEACGQTARNLCSCSGQPVVWVRVFRNRAKFYTTLLVVRNLDAAP